MVQQISEFPAENLPRRITLEEFLARSNEDEWSEWVDGEVIILSPATVVHQQIVWFLSHILGAFIDRKQLGMLLFAPFLMKLSNRPSGREPDILFVSNENLERVRDTFLDGPADLVVEVISLESQVRDRGDKFYEYEAAGVREYWLIDPLRKQAEFYLLNDQGIYQSAAIGQDGIYRSVVLDGLWLKVDWLWQKPLPPLFDVLKEWKLI